MSSTWPRGARGAIPGLVVLVVGAGCAEKTFWVRQYPEFYMPDLKVVAVAPFENDTSQAGAGDMFADQLAAALQANGTYRIIGPRELNHRMEEKGIPVTTQPTAELLTVELRRLGGIDAFIHGAVLSFMASRTGFTEWEYRPYYPYGYGNYGWGEWYENWQEGSDTWGGEAYPAPVRAHASHGHVAVRASMTRVSDGAVLYATPAPVSATVDVTPYAPKPPRDALMGAAARAAGQLVSRFAVVPVNIAVDADKDLVTASGKTGNEWNLSDRFRIADEKMYLVLHLPLAADRNAFRLTITPQGKLNNVLAAQDFVWVPSRQDEGFAFSPRQFAAGAGPGAYAANLYADGRFVMSHEFRVAR